MLTLLPSVRSIRGNNRVEAENEDVVANIGWTPHAADFGVPAGTSALTIARYTGGNHISSVSGSTPEELLREINGRAIADVTDPKDPKLVLVPAGQQLPGFGMLRDDGSTSCGNWIYSGAFTQAGNMTARRDTSDPSGLGVYPGWGFSWPANRRILYNRASADLQGKPWSERKKLVWWDPAAPGGEPDKKGKGPKAVNLVITG